MLANCFKGFCAAILILAAHAAQAGPEPDMASTKIQLAAAQCGFGYHRDVSGYCVDSMDYKRICPPGFFAVTFPNGNGFRCVPTEWMDSPVWLGNVL